MFRRFCCLISVATIAFLTASSQLQAQSGRRSGGTIIQRGSSTQGSTYRGGQSSSRVMGQPLTFEQKFWKYLKSSHYKQWSPAPGQTGDAYEAQSPHGAMLKMYLNRNAAGHPSEIPNASIFIKENYGPDGTTLMAITVMYKTNGYNPDAGDWYWVKYLPDGKVDRKETPNGAVKLAGKPTGCIECHAGAEGDDYVFFNDSL